ncbi:hypothetical protein [Shewanella surugensis]|uniref:Uncharacterized protein n=1 Tax=Shewanella surugensis TaxID=212020 RepID=A0ABT0LD77_9GAMM|nr:hypothetical protein [Shewanella surugensis]MCL1125666.1 hypothetical protein [Shewanella surugensis]
MNILLKIVQVNAIITILGFSSTAFSSVNTQDMISKVDNHPDTHEQCNHPIISRFPIVIF